MIWIDENQRNGVKVVGSPQTLGNFVEKGDKRIRLQQAQFPLLGPPEDRLVLLGFLPQHLEPFAKPPYLVIFIPRSGHVGYGNRLAGSTQEYPVQQTLQPPAVACPVIAATVGFGIT